MMSYEEGEYRSNNVAADYEYSRPGTWDIRPDDSVLFLQAEQGSCSILSTAQSRPGLKSPGDTFATEGFSLKICPNPD